MFISSRSLLVVGCVWGLCCSLGLSSDVIVPTVGLGTAGLQQGTHAAVLTALQLGVRMIDSAQAKEWYNEVGVGSALAEFAVISSQHVADDVVIVTKVHPRSFAYQPMDEMIAASRRNFRRENIDVVLLHSPWCWQGHCTPAEEAVSWTTGWHNLVKLQTKHTIKAIGVSNFHYEILHQLVVNMGQKVDVVQNWMDPFHQDREVREFCRTHGIQYMGYSSFGTQWNRHPNPVLSNPVLTDIAERHGVSVPQVVMKWLAALDVVTIPRTGKEAHMRDNFAELIQRQQQLQQSDSSQCDKSDQVCTASAVDDKTVDASNDNTASWSLSEEELQAIAALDATLGNPWD